MRFPELPGCHAGDPLILRFPPTWKSKDGVRTCSFCGSVHPEDLLRVLGEGADLEMADMKYGHPHKFYVRGVPNPITGYTVIGSKPMEDQEVATFLNAIDRSLQQVIWRAVALGSELDYRLFTGNAATLIRALNRHDDDPVVMRAVRRVVELSKRNDVPWSGLAQDPIYGEAPSTLFLKWYTDHLKEPDFDDETRGALFEAIAKFGVRFQFDEMGQLMWARC